MNLVDTNQSFGGMSRARSGRRVLVNVTSLIDVLFLLLIFFMVSSTFLEQPGMKLELPSAQSADISQLKSYVLYVFQDGRMRLNEREVTLENLGEALESAVPEMAESSLSLFADKNVPHGKVVKVMDLARQAGVRKLVIATTPEAREF